LRRRIENVEVAAQYRFQLAGGIMLNVRALWIEDLDNAADQQSVADNIKAMNANVVCVRTSSQLLPGLIPQFHQMGIRVYGWRWTSVVPKTKAFAKDEADLVANALIPAGLDGYIFDVESDENGSNHDWDRTDQGDLRALAVYYTQTIKKAAQKKERPFSLGLTSHAKGFANYPKIPWAPFLDVAEVLYPQTYWKYFDDKKKSCVPENLGTPASAMKIGFADYGPKGKQIIPVAGELRCATAQEVKDFGALLVARDLIDGHFYVNHPSVGADIFAAIKGL
jgi:hypothetical protein